jgi:hypothetical protein
MQVNETIQSKKSDNSEIKLSDGDTVAANKLIYKEVHKGETKRNSRVRISIILMVVIVAIIALLFIIL